MSEGNLTGLDGVNGTFDVGAYVQKYLGSQSLPYNTLIPITVIYVLTFIMGVFGNVTTMVVILTNQYMQTATNYYLFNLAVADMTTLVVGQSKSSLF
jgi:neuromedin U receptor 1